MLTAITLETEANPSPSKNPENQALVKLNWPLIRVKWYNDKTLFKSLDFRKT